MFCHPNWAGARSILSGADSGWRLWSGDGVMPVFDRWRAGYTGITAAVPIIDTLRHVMTLSCLKLATPQLSMISSSMRAVPRHRTCWHMGIEHGGIKTAGYVRERTSKPTSPTAHLANGDWGLPPVDPVASGKLVEQRLVGLMCGLHLDVFDNGRLPEALGRQPELGSLMLRLRASQWSSRPSCS
jgi:hypothetical protein